MRVFGLTGNTGTGKTTVARLLADRGVSVVDADVIAREVVEPGQPALREILQAFGDQYLDDAGRLRRQTLGRLVFSDANALRRLEAITHPRIAERANTAFAAAAAQGIEIAVYDSAILVETGLAESFAGLIVVTSSRELQLQRIVDRDGLSVDDAAARIDAQMPLAEKVALADYVLENVGSLEELSTGVDTLVRWMRQAK